MTVNFRQWRCADSPAGVYAPVVFRCLASSALSAAVRFAEFALDARALDQLDTPAGWAFRVWCFDGSGPAVEVEVELARSPVFLAALVKPEGGAK